MRKILFTKELDENWVRQNLHLNLQFEICPFLKIDHYPQEKLATKINFDSSKFIVTSQNSIHAISGLKLDGEFFVVGKSTAQKLTEKKFKVVHFENHALELANYILRNYQPQTWNFFCGNNRRDALFEALLPNGHLVTEIICYESCPVDHKIDLHTFHGIAFFSPLAVKTFFSTNSVVENTTIFSIGKTTTDEIRNHTKNKIITAEIPQREKVIEQINKYYDTEK